MDSNQQQAVALLERALKAVQAGEFDTVGLILVKGDQIVIQTAGATGSGAALHLGCGQMQTQIKATIFGGDYDKPALVRVPSFLS